MIDDVLKDAARRMADVVATVHTRLLGAVDVVRARLAVLLCLL